MGKRIAVVVVVDGLRADGLACYGNARAVTPFLDRLAAESVVFDFAYCLDPTIESFYRSAVLGIHPVYRYAGQGENALRLVGRPPVADSVCHYLITDDPAVAALDVEPFAWSDVCTWTPGGGDSRKTPGEAREFFESAASWLSGRFAAAACEIAVAWIHTSQITLRPLTSQGGDATETTRERYDAEVTAIDAGIRTFFGGLTFPDETSDILFIVSGARGYSLGERGGLGVEPVVLHEELLHVPLIVHDAGRRSDPFRTPQLASPLDLHRLLSPWLTGEPEVAASRGPREGDRHNLLQRLPQFEPVPDGATTNWLLFASETGERALRTPGWYLIRPSPAATQPEGEGQGVSPRLYLKPDDRWEFNEVGDRRPEITAALSERLDDLLNRAATGEALTLPPLPAELIKGG